MRIRKPFLVGVRNRRLTTVLLLRLLPSPLRGPWNLRALVAATRPGKPN